VIFGRVPAAAAAGAILAHSIRVGGGRFLKGRLLSDADAAALGAAGITEVTVARLEAGDVHENAAARAVAAALAGPGVRVQVTHTGRANLVASSAGILRLDSVALDAVNLVDEAITVATALPDHRVEAGPVLATIKIIPYAVARGPLDEALELARRAALSVTPFRAMRIGLVNTMLPGTKASLAAKGEQVMALRAAERGCTLAAARTVPHEEAAIAATLRDLHSAGCSPIVVIGATATADRMDVAPAGLVKAGGEIVHFGMPVDPGNLLLLGRLDGVPVVIGPGCARSPKENGFDWVLDRLLAGIEVTSGDIRRMGVGGLLKDVAARGEPRDEAAAPEGRTVAAVVLAAGRGQRMQGSNKLTALLRDKPIVAHAVDALHAAGINRIVIVTGHEEAAVRQALAGRNVTLVHNPEYRDGMAGSIRTGLEQLGSDVAGALVCLGDMPLVRPATIAALLAGFDPAEGQLVCVPVHQGRRGNPVLWSSRFFADLKARRGDSGGRALLETLDDGVVEVPVDDPGVMIDVDTRDALARLQTGDDVNGTL
jgi:molybdenum cofactor cytidylyltransferase